MIKKEAPVTRDSSLPCSLERPGEREQKRGMEWGMPFFTILSQISQLITMDIPTFLLLLSSFRFSVSVKQPLASHFFSFLLLLLLFFSSFWLIFFFSWEERVIDLLVSRSFSRLKKTTLRGAFRPSQQPWQRQRTIPSPACCEPGPARSRSCQK